MAQNAKMLAPRLDFEFAFNDTVFSNRVLRIEVMDDSLASGFDGLSSRKRRRRSENSQNKVGDEAAHHSSDSECSTSVNKVNTLFISSPILAANSPVFYKLFKNGMRESHDNVVTLRINASEEAAVMDLLKFAYTNSLSATTTTDLVNVLIAADKYEFSSCMEYCVELLSNLPVSLESACLYLDLPPSVLTAEATQPLKVLARLYLANLDLNRSQEEMMALPLSALEVVLGSDGPLACSEDYVFDFILKWARAHYTEPEERREILTNRLLKLICLPYMTNSKLRQALDCPDFDHSQVSNLVYEALFLKGELTYGKQFHVPNDEPYLSTRTSVQPVKRFYRFRPVTVVQLKCSRPRCVVYFELRKEEVENLNSRNLASQLFSLDGKRFMLIPHYVNDNSTSLEYFGLCVYALIPGNWTVDCEVAVMKKPLEEFEVMLKANKCPTTETTLAKGEIKRVIAKRNLFGIPWTDFMSNDSEYFTNGILHLRVQLTLNKL